MANGREWKATQFTHEDSTRINWAIVAQEAGVGIGAEGRGIGDAKGLSIPDFTVDKLIKLRLGGSSNPREIWI